MIRFYKRLFLNARFFIAGCAITVVFALSFILHWLFPVGVAMLVLLFVITIADCILLFSRRNGIEVNRRLPSLLSLGDENKITLRVTNLAGLKANVVLYDELPYQLQVRDFEIRDVLKFEEPKEYIYTVRPVTRGRYLFGNINVFISSQLGFVSKKQVIEAEEPISVYPSIIQMKKYELKAHAALSHTEGIKRHRKIGHSYEFDQIKEYVVGDDNRSVNWKASSRRGALMVNQYEDERAQQIYSIIDKSRAMHMPFNNLTLLDHAINTSLVISNIILQKHDKAGLITFSDKIGTILPADKSSQQLRRILEALYNEQEHNLEANYELFFHLVRNVVKQRSLIFLYTNFESYHAFERIMPILRRVSKLHLLVVVFFENEDVISLSTKEASDIKDIYLQIIARKYREEKRQIVTELNNYGIHAIKTLPQDLSINTINKYLELKSRGMI
jgi:uncharacterized protein (DUF58 family)